MLGVRSDHLKCALGNTSSIIFIFVSIMSLQARISDQFLVTCVWLTDTAVQCIACCQHCILCHS